MFLYEVLFPDWRCAVENQQDRLRVVFMGAHDLSCAFLKALAGAPDMDVVSVVTRPDRRKGRNMQLLPGPVKSLAMDLRIPFFTPEKVNAEDSVGYICGLRPDVIVVMAYGQFLKERLLFSAAPLGCVNLHMSLLPKRRGACPLERGIMAGDSETGVTAMMMDMGMDTGDILGAVRTPILPSDTLGTLRQKLAPEGADLMLRVLRSLRDGTAVRTPQDDSQATYAYEVKRQESLIEWTRSADEIERQIRALNPAPCCQTFLPPMPGAPPSAPGMLLKVYEAGVEQRPADCPPDILPGTVISMKKGPLVATGNGGALRLLLVRPEGRQNIMKGSDFSNGYSKKVPPGSRLYIGISPLFRQP